jgi:tetratricopeptide (TPR) repeat protein
VVEAHDALRNRVTMAFADEPETEVVALVPANSAPHAVEVATTDIAKLATRAQAENSRHQLPPPLATFTGRALELAVLHTALANSATLCLQGPGGTGKTALAVALAHRLAARYPEAQFYLDLKGASARPLPVAAAQAHVLRALHPNARLPESEAGLRQSYQAALTGQRVLLLLDNAANAQQVSALLPPPGSLVIVTARQAFTLPGSFQRQLDVLPEREAEELLLRLTPRIGAQADKLARQCGYLPLALSIAASTLAQRPELTAANYSWKLAQVYQRVNASGPPKPVETVLTLSYELLSPGLQKLWRSLAVFPDSFDVTGAAAVWGLHPERARKALRRLLEFELIEGQLAAGRFRLRDIRRSFVESLLSPAERRDAQQSHAEYYQSVLHEADALYEHGGEVLKRGLVLLDREWHNIEAGQHWALSNAAHDRDARELCSSYPDAGRYVLELRQHPRERIRWCEGALAAAHKLGRGKAESRHLLALGQAYLQLGEVQHALVCYDKALELARAQGDKGGEARALNGLGAAYYLGGGLGDARNYHNQAWELARILGEQRVEAQAIGGLGLICYALGELRRALELLEQQLALARKAGDRRGEAQALGSLGLARAALGEATEALDLLEEQLAIAREIGDRRGEAGALSQLGRVHAELKHYDQSQVCYEQALFIAREIGDRRSEAAALGGSGRACAGRGEVERALASFEGQLRLAREIGDQANEALALGQLGEAYAAQGELLKACDALQHAFELCAKNGDIAGQGAALFKLALAYDQRGDRERAIIEAQTALELFLIAESEMADQARRQLAVWGVLPMRSKAEA